MLLKIDNKLNGFLKDSNDFAGMSKSLLEKLERWDSEKAPIKRLDWHTYFIGIALLSSLRSTDGRTRVGCCVVDRNNTILTTAFNGVIRGVDERIFPNYNEEKYQFFLHGEENALLNLARKGQTSLNSIVYITGPPCFSCAQKMYQAGVSKVFHIDQKINMLDNQDYKDNMELFTRITSNNMPIIPLSFKKEEFLKVLVEELK